MNFSPPKLREWIRLMQHGFDTYDSAAKKRYATLGKMVAQYIADELGLRKSQYEIRWNPGGPAVAGDVILHTDRFTYQVDAHTNQDTALYVNLGRTSMGGKFMARACAGRTDYTGSDNTWFHVSDVLDVSKFIPRLEQCPRNARVLEWLSTFDKV